MVDSRKVKDRRHPRFNDVDEAIRDAQALAQAERQGTLRAVGNWELGQAVGHVAYWARAPFEGYPPMRRPPWLLRVITALLKRRLLTHGFPAGVRIPGTPEGTFGLDRMPTDQALEELRAAFARLASQPPPGENPVFGPLSHDEWIKLNLRHAELHFGFFHSVGHEQVGR